MSDHDRILDTLGPGDICAMPENQTVSFLGRTWNVKSLLLDEHGGALLIQRAPVEQVSPGEIVADLMKLAANVLVIATDWSKATPDQVAGLGVQMFATHFPAVYNAHMAMLDERGKPS